MDPIEEIINIAGKLVDNEELTSEQVQTIITTTNMTFTDEVDDDADIFVECSTLIEMLPVIGAKLRHDDELTPNERLVVDHMEEQIRSRASFNSEE